MFDKLYLVSEKELNKIETPKVEEEKPILSYAEIYDAVVAAKEDVEKKKVEKWISWKNAARSRKSLLQYKLSNSLFVGDGVKKKVQRKVSKRRH